MKNNRNVRSVRTQPRHLVEGLESRVMLSGSVGVKDIAPYPGYPVHGPVSGPFAPPVLEVGTKTKTATSHGKGNGKGGDIPVIPPPTPTITITNLGNPSDGIPMTVPAGAKLFGAWNGSGVLIPVKEDVNQGQIGDCWVLGEAEAMVISNPFKLVSMLTETSDSYLYQFAPNQFYRVDKTLYTNQSHIGPNNAVWPLVLEKIEAMLHNGAFMYLNGGWMTTSARDLGWRGQNTPQPTTAAAMAAWIDTTYAAGGNITYGTNSSTDGSVVASHCYILTGYSVDSLGNYTFTMYQPWGVQYAVTQTFTQLTNGVNFFPYPVVTY